jgi:hypothetical protein
MEVMVGTVAVRSLIRESKTHQLPSIIQVSAKYGMQSLDQQLKELVYNGVISKEDAIERSNNKYLFDQSQSEGIQPAAPGAEVRGAAQRPNPFAPPPPQPGAAQPSGPQPPAAQDDSWMQVYGPKK